MDQRGLREWQVVYNAVHDLPFGAEITHEALMELLGTHDRGRVYRAVSRANRELWTTRSRSLDVVRGVGYRMLHPSEMEGLANFYKAQGRRKIANSVAVIDAVDLRYLAPAQRTHMLKVQTAFRLLAQGMDQHAAHLAAHDSILQRMQERIDDVERRIGSPPSEVPQITAG